MITLSHLSLYDRDTFALLGLFVETSFARTIDAGKQAWRLVSLHRDEDDDLVTVTLRSDPDGEHIVRFQLTTFDFPLLPRTSGVFPVAALSAEHSHAA